MSDPGGSHLPRSICARALRRLSLSLDEKSQLSNTIRAFQVAQWWRIRLPMQEPQEMRV